MALLESDTEVREGLAVLTLSGELDLAGVAMLEREVERVLAGPRPDAVVLDLRRLTFMDSSGLRLVMLVDARSREGGWRLALVPGPEAVHRVFEITRMAERLTWVGEPDEARTQA